MARKNGLSNTIWLYLFYLAVFIAVPFFTLHSIISLEVAKNPTTICYWWWILLLVYALVLSVILYFFRRAKMVTQIFWSVLLGLFLYTIHWILDGFFVPTRWCHWFGLFEISIFAAYLAAVIFYKNTAPVAVKARVRKKSANGLRKQASASR